MDILRNGYVLSSVIEKSIKLFKKESFDGSVDLVDVCKYIINELDVLDYPLNYIIREVIFEYHKECIYSEANVFDYYIEHKEQVLGKVKQVYIEKL